MRKPLIIYFLQLLRQYLKNGIYILKHDGLHRLFLRIKIKLKYYYYYNLWIKKHEPAQEKLKKQTYRKFAYEPKISVIVPAYNTPRRYLVDMIESVRSQTYPHWELCIADGGGGGNGAGSLLVSYAKKDKRIKVKLLRENKGIAGNSNEALSLADGDFVALLDHDDVLPPFALFEVVKAVNDNQAADFIYSDEDYMSEGGTMRFQPHFKPDWSPDTLRSYNYITHLSVIKREILDRIGLFREGYEGSQDYDLIVRATEQAKHIIHIPKILYHWRYHKLSMAGNPDHKPYAHESGKRLLRDHLHRLGIEGSVEDGLCPNTFKVVYPVSSAHKVSILIPNKDHAEDLERCVTSILTKSSYKNYEVAIIDNGSSDDKTLHLYDKLKAHNDNITIVACDRPFNFAAMNNFGVTRATGDVLVFLNNDTEVISSDWLERMLEHAVRKEIGAVGAKLYYPGGKIQHAGVVIGIGGVAGHTHKYFDRESFGYFSRLKVTQNFSAVTGACLMMRKDVFTEVGGFDENFSHSYNDVDLCLKIRQRGFLIVFTPYAELYHQESKSRGNGSAPEKQAEFQREIELFRLKWGDVLRQGDPYYSVNLSLDREDFFIRVE